MKTKLLAILLLAGSSMFARSHFSFGVGIGVAPYYPYGGYYYAAPPPPVYYSPYYSPYYAPGPGYAWVGGYYGPRHEWRRGYWARRPFAGAVWVGPRWSRGRYYGGYWRR